MTGRLRQLQPGAAVRRLDPGARTAPLTSATQADNAARAKIYASARWRRCRRLFLNTHPLCSTPGCNAEARVVDHRDGHMHQDWLARFWDHTRWDALCLPCHAIKSGRELQEWRRAGHLNPGGAGVRCHSAAEIIPAHAAAYANLAPVEIEFRRPHDGS